MSNRVTKNKCIFCFKELKRTDICFETVDDGAELVPDPVKYEYHRQFDPDISPMDVRCMSRSPKDENGDKPASVTSDGIRYYTEGATDFDLDQETGIPTAWRKQGVFEVVSTRRLCGNCHQPLPHSFGRIPNVTIGFCGNSAAGKTVYMTSLIKDLGRLPGMSVTPDPVFYRGLDTPWEEYYERMNNSQGSYYVLPPATNPLDPLSPLVLNCSYTNKRGKNTEFSITLFDMAGEGLGIPSYMAKKAIYLRNAAGIVFLKNPDYFQGMKKEDQALTEHQYLQILVDEINRNDKGSDRAHLAITMTKTDLLLNRYGAIPEFNKMLGNMFNGDPLTQHPDGFNVVRAMNSNRHIYDLYAWDNTRDQQLRNLYVRTHDRKPEKQEKIGFFARLFGWGRSKKEEPEQEPKLDENVKQWVMLFAACPLGRDVEVIEDELTAESRLNIQPQGILNVDPVLWLLYCCDIFPPKLGADD